MYPAATHRHAGGSQGTAGRPAAVGSGLSPAPAAGFGCRLPSWRS